MSKRLTGLRADLEAAITIRNGAAKEVDAAERAFVECVGKPLPYRNPNDRSGEKLHALQSSWWDTERRREGLEKENRDVEKRHGGDNLAVLRHFLDKYDGHTPDELIAEAKAAEAEAQKRYAAMQVERDKLAVAVDDAQYRLNSAVRSLDAAIMAVLHEQIVPMAAEIMADMKALLKKSGALRFLARDINFRHRDNWFRDFPYYEAGSLLGALSSLNGGLNSDLNGICTEAQRQGEAIWQAAFNRLSVDAGAPLPVEAIAVDKKEAA